MEWTTTPPAEPGCYWAYDGNIYPVEVEATHWKENPLEVFIPGNEFAFALSDFTHWMGPLTAPAAPEPGQ